MKTLFICTVEYNKTLENGLVKKVSEQYLLDAFSFIEAETRIREEISPFVENGTLTVSKITKAKSRDIIQSNEAENPRFYKAKTLFTKLDERNGVEKKIPVVFFVQAEDFSMAYNVLKNKLRDTISEVEIASITETPIIDFYRWEDK